MKRIAILLPLLALAAAATEPAMKPGTAAIAAAEARTVIPSVEWKQAAFTNVLADVEAKANKAAPAGSPRFRIRLDEAVTNEIPAITMRAGSIGLLPLLSMLADMTGLEHSIQEGQIVFGLPSAPAAAAPAASSAQPAQSAAARALLEDPTLIIHRQYPIRGAKTTAADATKLKEWFAGKGIAWPEGSSLSLPVPGTLTVANTRENLDRIEYILRQLPSQQTKP